MPNTKEDLQAKLAEQQEVIENLVAQVKDLEEGSDNDDPITALMKTVAGMSYDLVRAAMENQHQLMVRLVEADPAAFVEYQKHRTQASVHTMEAIMAAYPEMLKHAGEITKMYAPVMPQSGLSDLVN